MTEPRFFVAPEAIRGRTVTFSPEQGAQIARVLRLGPGHVVYVLDNRGHIYTVRLDVVSRRETRGHIVDVQEAKGEPPLFVTLYVALLKGEKMDWVLQKSTEIGISRFVPMLTHRTVVRRRDPRPRWTRILQEAAEQCGRAFIPELAPILPWQEALATAQEELRLIGHNGADVPPLRAVLQQQVERPQRVGIFIGPEGGFTEEEVAQAQDVGFLPVYLGPRTLRAETAALVLSALVLHHWGDIG